ncbi:MAG TPA: hypothetical protein VN735_00165 [Steroidobacteraceae bacterium]|nr:hypothetical protein [Steroidobacteraceae bacterium]
MIAVYAPPPKQITVDLYQQMGEKGLLTGEDRVQLIEGEILEMPLIGPRHGSVTGRLAKWLYGIVGDAAIVRLGNPGPQAFPKVRTRVASLFVDSDQR